MAYILHINPNLLDIPALIRDFAVDVLGWQLVGDIQLRPAQMDADLSFKITAGTDGTAARYNHYVNVSLTRSGSQLGRLATMLSPYINGAYQAPTRLHLFGGNEPESYLAAAVEYDPGYFRHLYMGYVEKIGNYDGGEVIGGSYRTKSDNNAYDYGSYEHHYLFSGANWGGQPYSATHTGTLRIVSPEVGGETFANFIAPARNSSANLTVGAIFGGYADNPNRQSVAVGNSPFSGTSQLIPINLFRGLAENRCQPVGRPTGVRLVNMSALDPNTSVLIGDSRWRVFPAFKLGPAGAVGSQHSDESSYIIGYAYLEN